MIALPSPSPPSFPNLGWSFESPDHQQNNNYFCTSIPPYNYHHEETQTFLLADSNNHVSTSYYDLQLLPPQIFHSLPAANSFTPDISSNGDTKKLHHNASERDRRKKMNTLYSSLRSLLPAADDMKKWSIPSTVARVVKYIPELQQEVQKLIVEKEKLLSTIANQEVQDHNQTTQQHNPAKETNNISLLSGISMNRLENGDVVIQMPAQKSKDRPSMSELLLNLEEQGLLPLNASSFESFSGSLIFYNLHLQVKENYKVDYGDLNERLVSLLGKKKKN